MTAAGSLCVAGTVQHCTGVVARSAILMQLLPCTDRNACTASKTKAASGKGRCRGPLIAGAGVAASAAPAAATPPLRTFRSCGDHRRTRPPQSGVGGQNLPLADVTRALSHAAGCPDRIESLTIEGAVRRMGPIAEAFALDQQFSGARARRELGWSPTRLDALAELAQG